MYITNDPAVAKIAADAGVDRIFIDMEVLGKAERQGGMDTVQSHHVPEDIVASYPELKNHSLAFLMDICLLKYNEATSRLADLDSEERCTIMPRLKGMQRYIRRRARQALWDREIYWKTRISYLLK